MAVLLNKAYGGHVAGSIREFSAELEAALIAQGIASASVIASVTTGAQNVGGAYSGTVAFAIGAASLVITSDIIKANTKVHAAVAQAAADSTLLRIERIVSSDGSVTLYGTAAATAVTLVDWAILPTVGLVPAQ